MPAAYIHHMFIYLFIVLATLVNAMCVTECNHTERVHKLVGQKGAVDSLFLEACVSYKNLRVWVFQKFSSTFICSTVIDMYDDATFVT